MNRNDRPTYVQEPLFEDSEVTGTGQPYPWPQPQETPEQARELETLRQGLPLDDPDRHTLDTIADQRFAALATHYGTAA